MADTILVAPGEEFEAPGQCPECGGHLIAWVEEWESVSKRPTHGGLYVACAQDWEKVRTGEADHRHWQSDWERVNASVERWAEERVRVKG